MLVRLLLLHVFYYELKEEENNFFIVSKSISGTFLEDSLADKGFIPIETSGNIFNTYLNFIVLEHYLFLVHFYLLTNSCSFWVLVIQKFVYFLFFLKSQLCLKVWLLITFAHTDTYTAFSSALFLLGSLERDSRVCVCVHFQLSTCLPCFGSSELSTPAEKA